MEQPPRAWKAFGETVVHVAIGTLLFIVVALPAIGLDYLVTELPKLGVSSRIVIGLEVAEYTLFGVDLILFLCAVFRTGWRLLKSL